VTSIKVHILTALPPGTCPW